MDSSSFWPQSACRTSHSTLQEEVTIVSPTVKSIASYPIFKKGVESDAQINADLRFSRDPSTVIPEVVASKSTPVSIRKDCIQINDCATTPLLLLKSQQGSIQNSSAANKSLITPEFPPHRLQSVPVKAELTGPSSRLSGWTPLKLAAISAPVPSTGEILESRISQTCRVLSDACLSTKTTKQSTHLIAPTSKSTFALTASDAFSSRTPSESEFLEFNDVDSNTALSPLSSSSRLGIGNALSGSCSPQECNSEPSLVRLSNSAAQQFVVAIPTQNDAESQLIDPVAIADTKKERFLQPPSGIITAPQMYGLNLGIVGELVKSTDVEHWEFPSLDKLKALRIKLISFMGENKLKQADICRFTGLRAPYLSFMVKDPTVSNFSPRRRVEVYSVLQTFFSKVDKNEITSEEIARLVLLSRATARAANSSRRGSSKMPGVCRAEMPGVDGAKPGMRRRRRGRPRILDKSREYELCTSELKPNSFNFVDVISGLTTTEDYDGKDRSSLGDGLVLCSKKSNTQKLMEENGIDLDESLDEWKNRFSDLFDKVLSSLDENVSKDRIAPLTSGEPIHRDVPQCTTIQQQYITNKNTSTILATINDVLQDSIEAFNPESERYHEKQHSLLQNLVTAAAKVTQKKSLCVPRPLHVPKSCSSPCSRNTASESQSQIFEALLNEVTHKQPHSAPLKKVSLSEDEKEGEAAPIHSLMRNDADELKSLSSSSSLSSGHSQIDEATVSEEGPSTPDSRDSNEVFQCEGSRESLTSLLQKVIEIQPSHQEKDIVSFDIAKSKNLQKEPTCRFGTNWWKEVDVGCRCPFDRSKQIVIGSKVSLDEKDLFSRVTLPRSGKVCAVRLQWCWDNSSSDEDILWDVAENGTAIEAFVEAYIRELGLPRNPVGSQLLLSFRKQVESARSFEALFVIVCQHLSKKFGQRQFFQLPGMTRKILLDVHHSGLRVIDAVSWSLLNSLDDTKNYIKILMEDMNLPCSFVTVLFPAFVRALAKEKLVMWRRVVTPVCFQRFVYECGGLLPENSKEENLEEEIRKEKKRKFQVPAASFSHHLSSSRQSKKARRVPQNSSTDSPFEVSSDEDHHSSCVKYSSVKSETCSNSRSTPAPSTNDHIVLDDALNQSALSLSNPLLLEQIISSHLKHPVGNSYDLSRQNLGNDQNISQTSGRSNIQTLQGKLDIDQMKNECSSPMNMSIGGSDMGPCVSCVQQTPPKSQSTFNRPVFPLTVRPIISSFPINTNSMIDEIPTQSQLSGMSNKQNEFPLDRSPAKIDHRGLSHCTSASNQSITIGDIEQPSQLQNPILIRTAGPLVTKAIFLDAVRSPQGLVTQSPIKHLPEKPPGEVEWRRTTRRSELGNPFYL